MKTASAPERFISSIKKHMHADEFASLEACLDCRNCGSACAWYLGSGDDTLHPKYKKDFIREVYRKHIHPVGRLAVALRLRAPLSEDTLRSHLPYFWKCTTCGRCTLSCPLGLSNRCIMRLGRTAFCDSGLLDEHPVFKEILDGSRTERHSFALSKEKILLRFGFLLAQDGTLAPIDVHGTDFLYVGAAAENTRFPDYGIKVVKILNAAGIRYTFSSRLTDSGTDVEHVVVDRALSKEMLEDVEWEADRLQAKAVLISECGCDIRTFYVEAGSVLGRPFRYPVQSLDSLLLQKIKTGSLPVQKIPGQLTFHDPCKVVRLTGMGDLTRELLHEVAETITEMSPNHEYNYCCNGGTGPLRLPENAQLRRDISHIKAKQIQATHAERVVTPCSVCMLTLEDICQTYQLAKKGQRMSFMMFEIVYEAMKRALDTKDQASRVSIPAVFFEKNSEFIFKHSPTGVLHAIALHTDMQPLLHWLSNDSIVARHIQANQDGRVALQRFLDHYGAARAKGEA